MVGIYKITNIINNKCYIGQSFNIRQRLRCHKRKLCCGTHINKHLQSAWNKYGENNFTFDVIELCEKDISPESLTEREQYWIDFYGGTDSNNTYNNREAGNKGHLSDYSKYLVSIHNKGKKVVITEDTKQKISNSLKGRPAKNKGIPVSYEIRQKISKRLKGRKKGPMSKETKRKLSEAHKGRTAWNKGIPNIHKGEKWSEERKIKSRNLESGRRGYKVAQYKLTGEFIAEYPSTMEAERKTGIYNSNIGACCRGLQNTAGGYIWKKVSC